MVVSAKFNYGGQAVIEGVMIRGRRFVSLAVRRPSGDIALHSRGLSTLYTGRLRQLPFVRGVIVLAETLMLGVRALTFSANVALEEEGGEKQELSRWVVSGMVALSLTLGIGLFFVAPLFAARALDPLLGSDFVGNLAEGVIRLVVFVAYLSLIGLMPDIRRVFAYHGAEHMAVHAHEAGDPMEVAALRKYPTAHPRCGTAFLLVVMVVSIVVFSLLGRPSLLLQVLYRVALIPAIAAVSYEVIRFSGAYAGNVLVRLVVYPSLALQSLTTRQPDDQQLEVAICAMGGALAADEGVVEVASGQGWVEHPAGQP